MEKGVDCLNKLLNDSTQSNNENDFQCYFKTENSENRDSYFERPTL
jgi:hypothetical protein